MSPKFPSNSNGPRVSGAGLPWAAATPSGASLVPTRRPGEEHPTPESRRREEEAKLLRNHEVPTACGFSQAWQGPTAKGHE